MKPRSFAGKGLALHNMRGFSMIEVLMALVVITFGLLGVAGMQAVSVGNTSTAGYRSIAALQAQSIASAMSANPTYWQSAKVPTSITVSVSGTTPTLTAAATGASTASGYNFSVNSASPLSSGTYPATCQTNACTSPAALAQYDVMIWGDALYNTLPGGSGTITCNPSITTTTTPVTVIPTACKIVINWTEKVLSQNQTAISTSTATSFDFEMAVVP